MRTALDEAIAARDAGEVPIGALVVKDGVIVSKAHNLVESLKDATAHAELIALREACAALKERRLEGCTLYSTVCHVYWGDNQFTGRTSGVWRI